MANLYVRVDDRLIHGQTIVAWCPTLSIKKIIVVDDESTKNPMLKSIMLMGVPSSYKAEIVTVEEAKKILAQPVKENSLLIVKTPERLLQIQTELESAASIMLGNLAKRQDTIYKVSGATGIFYLSEEDVRILNSFEEMGKEVFLQQLPTTNKMTWQAFKKTNL